MEEDFYDFEENVLNNMYTYITDRVDYYKKNPFKYRNENWYMIGDLITTSYFKYNSYIVKEYFLDWVHNVKSNFSEDDLSPFIVETFWNIKKVIEKLSDDTIMSWGLNATIIKYAFNKIDDGDSFETAISKLSEEFSKTEDYILNDDTFNIGYLFESIWPH